MLHRRRHQPRAGGLCLPEFCFEFVTERHQLIHLGDDAALFGKRWKKFSNSALPSGLSPVMRITYLGWYAARSLFSLTNA